jgi:hypothetical protein
MEFDLENALALLARTPASLNALLRDLPIAWTDRAEGESTMTPREVVAHLIDAERHNWLPRIHVILQHGETQPLPAFNRFDLIRESKGIPLAELIDLFDAERAQRLHELRALALTPADLARRGNHPALGSLTLAQLIAAWTVHDLTHLHQITRTLAHQYCDQVGPFQKFLGVLHCTGHSASA